MARPMHNAKNRNEVRGSKGMCPVVPKQEVTHRHRPTVRGRHKARFGRPARCAGPTGVNGGLANGFVPQKTTALGQQCVLRLRAKEQTAVVASRRGHHKGNVLNRPDKRQGVPT